MIKSIDELSNHIEKKCKEIYRDKKYVQECMKEAYSKYGISLVVSSNIINGRNIPSEYGEFVLFCILDIIDHNSVGKYYTESEIDYYSKSKSPSNKITFPFKISNMVQVAPDQWIGSTTVKDIIRLRDSQLVNYNENTQRVLMRVVDGENVTYKTWLNKKMVGKIEESYESGNYIPNTITLNMPEDTEFTYSGGALIIKKIRAFDIIDGYHRYIALSNIYNKDNNWDYPMELRIVCFHESRAKQFIYQEDQKTSMLKMHSNFYNQSDYGNQIASFLNGCGVMSGLINVNNGVIDASALASVINCVFFTSREKRTRANMLRVRGMIADKMETFVSNNTHLTEQQWPMELVIAFVLYANGECKDPVAGAKAIGTISKNYVANHTINSARKKVANV